MNDEYLAYDLSLYETSEERIIERKSKKENKIIKARTKFAWAKVIPSIVCSALVLGLLFAVVFVNSEVTRYTAQIEKMNSEIVKLESEQDYLNFTLESKMSLDEIENYAVGTLGMVKMEPARKKYVELEGENKIVVNDTSVTTKLGKFIQPALTYLMP